MAKKKTYSDKLKDPRWQKKRLEILERDGWKCMGCGSKEETIHVHHFSYQKNKDPWDYPSEVLIALCETCHQSEHDEQGVVEQELQLELEFMPVAIQFKVTSIIRTMQNSGWAQWMAWECLEAVIKDRMNELVGCGLDMENRKRLK